ncbi:barstar family protein [Streptacidiphilus jiangxiensis]|uniref:Barstar (Barnase inhibitor) n=1 Tax=Streptacidiphilus jiangxiensis TaxID=235985 RepID=A0A1H7MFY3_STRJI|nr:barstar family protein [Streptacidiphilus jiangxiensis]SEL10153.1 Barstar (barnase inhibitor) [Streptacidiphilus jiangxiensis]
MSSGHPLDLGRGREPWVVFARQDADVVDAALRAFAAGGGRIHRFRATDLHDEQAVHREFAARLAFPGYFGHNWDAVVDCLGDLCTVATDGIGITGVVDRADALVDTPFLRVLVSVLCQGAARANAETDLDGDPLDRPAHAQHWLFLLDDHPTASLAARLDHPDLLLDLSDTLLTVTLNPEVWA